MSGEDKTVKHRPPKPKYVFKRNTLPPLLGLLTFIATLVILNFQWFFAQLQYQIASQVHMPVISIDTSVAASARPEEAPSLWIPKIDVHAPIVFESSASEGKIQQALREGVVHYPMTAAPGEPGNVVIFGHSSGQPWAPGNYKFIFTLLDKLQKGDQVVIDFSGTRYVYVVRQSYVVDPYKTSILNSTDQSVLTLVTCTPVGTSAKRLVVVADQVSPKKPAQDKKAPDDASITTPKELPGNAPGFWQSLTDIF